MKCICSTDERRLLRRVKTGGGEDNIRNGTDKWDPVTTAWRVIGLRMEKWPADMEGSCECIE